MDGIVESWVDGELGGCSLADDRLIKRLRKLLAQIGSAMGQSIPLVRRGDRVSLASALTLLHLLTAGFGPFET
jgi:hypothetical protein